METYWPAAALPYATSFDASYCLEAMFRGLYGAFGWDNSVVALVVGV